MNRIVYLIIISLFFIQCDNSNGKSVPFKDVPGKQLHLEEENIYLFVPDNIKLYSNSEYVEHINKIENKEIQKIERARYLDLKYGSAGNYYIMASNDQKTAITFKTVPYMEIDQSLSQLLLKYLSRQHKALGKAIGLESNFERAGIITKEGDRIFRAIFFFKGYEVLTKKEITISTYFYLINKKGKSFVLSFESQENYDFDSYVQKIRL
jgi:hypothetical protein